MDFILYIGMKEKILFKIKTGIDFFLPKIFVFFTGIWLIQSIYAIVMVDPFSAIHLWIVELPIHAITSLNFMLLYLVNHFFFRTFMPGHIRVVRAVLFTMVGIFFYDFAWSVCCVTINGYGSFLLPLTSFIATLGFIYIINKQSFIIRLNWRYIIPAIAVYLVSLIIFINSGFFQQLALWEQMLWEHGLDPHGWEWAFNKAVALWIWMSIANR